MTDSTSTFHTDMHRIFENSADSYDQTGVEFFRPIGRRLVEFAGLADGESVLDVACGCGAVLLPAAEAVGSAGSALGIDLAESMLGHAEAEARRRGLDQARTDLLDGQQPPLPAESFDAVLSSCGAMFWIGGANDLLPYRELLRPGGRFALSAPSFFGAEEGRRPVIPEQVSDLLESHMTAIAENIPSNNPFVHPEGTWLADPERIRSSLREAGFDEVEVREENLPVVVESGEQWVEWTKSHGMRMLWAQLDEQRAAELSAEVARRLDALRGADGWITLDTPIAYIVARTPQS